MRSAIVTGCTGAIGTALIDELNAAGWRVLAVPRRGSKRTKSIPVCENVSIVECNIEDIETLPEIEKGQYDAFFHLGWSGTYGEDRNDVEAQNRNVEYTLRAVKCAKAMGCSVFVGAGSQSEYGHVEGRLTPELPCNPVTAYGAAKLAACNESRRLCQELGIRHIWCRILSVYGPRDGEYTMVMSVIRELLSGKVPACTKGEQIWDYIYSKDAARALRCVAERGKDTAVYCIGSGQPRTLRAYIEAIRDAIDPGLMIGFGMREYYPNQVMHLEADISSLSADTGFAVQYTFEKGIRETIEWVRNAYLLERTD